jgi:cupin 2 domain-containing protein
MNNLLQNIPKDLPEELFDTLVLSDSVHIERIVSKGHSTPKDEWYEQDQNEFVLLLKGAARLEFDDGSETQMGPGDCLKIPAHRKHRVAWTPPEAETIWLAVHYP